MSVTGLATARSPMVGLGTGPSTGPGTGDARTPSVRMRKMSVERILKRIGFI